MSDTPPVSDGPRITNDMAEISQTTYLPKSKRQPGVVMADASYKRIQDRILNKLGRQAPSAWIGAAFALFGVSASAGIARLVLPEGVTGLPPGTRLVLIVVTVLFAFAGTLCVVAHRSRKSSIQELANDICEEMDTYAMRH